MGKSFYVYRRNGDGWADLVRRATGHLWVRDRVLPLGVVVHPSRRGETREALAKLDLGKVRVETSGGCVTEEVWLEVKDGEAKKRGAGVLPGAVEVSAGD